MAKSRAEKIASFEERIDQLMKQKKQETQKLKADERKERTKRLCKRHALLEKFMPDLATITDEQFEVFIKTGIDTTYGRNKLAEIISKAKATQPPQSEKTANPSGNNPNAKSTESTPQTQAAESDKSDGGATVEG